MDNPQVRVFLAISEGVGRENVARRIQDSSNLKIHFLDPMHVDKFDSIVSDFSTPALLIADSKSFKDVFEVVEAYSLLRPDSTCVLLSDSQDSDFLSNAMKVGVRLVCSVDDLVDRGSNLIEQAVRDAVTRWQQLKLTLEDVRVAKPLAKIISVMSPKGGVGKTTLATNLAIGLAKLNPSRVVLVDLDLQFGDVATAMQLNPTHTLLDAVKGPSKSDSLVLKTFLTEYVDAKLWVIPGAHKPEDGSKITAAEVSHLIEQLRELFDFVVIDTAPGFPDYVVDPLADSDLVVVVTELDVPSIRGTKKALEVLDKLGVTKNRRSVVLNKSKRGTGITAKDVHKLLGDSPKLVLPRSKKVTFSTNNGVPILASDDLNRVRSKLRKFVVEILKNLGSPIKGKK